MRRSKNYLLIIDEINKFVSNGKVDSLLQKLEFDFQINSVDELSNFILILLVLIENTYSSAASSNILLRKVLNKVSQFKFVKSELDLFEIIKANRVLPYVGLSETIRRMISTIIYNKDVDSEIISRWPNKEYFVNFNIYLLNDYLNNNDNVKVRNALTLLYNSVRDIDSENKVYLDNNAIALFKIYLIKYKHALTDYLHIFIRFQRYGGSRNWHEGKLIVPEPFYIQLFGSSNEFLSFLDDNTNIIVSSNDDIILLGEIKTFIETYDKKKSVAYDQINITPELHYNLLEELKPNVN